MTDAALLDHISRLPHAQANFKQLVRELGAQGPKREELESRAGAPGGARRPDRDCAPATTSPLARSREFAVGRLNMHRDGYGFLISGPARSRASPAIFSFRRTRPARPCTATAWWCASRASSRTAAPTAKSSRCSSAPTLPWSANSGSGAAGCSWCRTTSGIRQWIEIPEGHGDSRRPAPPIDRIGAEPLEVSEPADLDGMIVNVELLEYPENGERAVGRVIEILGRPDDFGVDVEIVIRKHHLPHHFPPEVVEQAEAVPERDRGGGTGGPAGFPRAATSSPSTAKRRAISTMRCGWTACPTATTRCTCTSPT